MSDYDSAASKKEHFEGGRIHVLRTELVGGAGIKGSQRTVDVTVSADALRTLSSAGRVVDRSPAIAKETFRVWLTWAGGPQVVDFAQVVHR